MRIAGEDVSIDTQLGILFHPLDHVLNAPNQSGSCAAAHKPNSGPKIGADLQVPSRTLCTSQLVQREHPLLSNRVLARHGLLGDSNRAVRQLANYTIRVSPSVLLCFPYDD